MVFGSFEIMTWIVGTPTMFGYGIGISDVRVTLADGSERDCLQKIYPVGRFVAMGFAGSVLIGFTMLEVISKLLHTNDENGMWDPEAVAAWWPRDAEHVFESFPAEERALQSHLMMISAFPNVERKDAPWPRSFVHIFKSPRFEAASIPVHKLGAIGCGTAVEPCQKIVDDLSNNYDSMFSMMKGEQGCPGGMANTLGFSLTSVLKDNQPRGISAHLHYCWVYCKKVIIKTNDHSVSGRWSSFSTGSGVNEPDEPASVPKTKEQTTFTMPEIASSWAELERLLDAAGAIAKGCVA
jgi:hypothetical protein